MDLKVYQTSPFIVEKIWGGSQLGKFLGLTNKIIGETWHASTLIEGPSFETRKQKTLDHFLQLPYLLKLIDTSDHLSIQVHPDDDYAKKNNLGSGKSECWLILEAQKGAGIYLGFQENVSKEDFFRDVKASKDISPYLNFFAVKSGDFFYVPAGTIHAIGKDVLLLEVQQSSGVTYRVWDWNRTDDNGQPRELHIEQALKITNFDLQFNRNLAALKQENLFSSESEAKCFLLVEHANFKATLLTISAQNSSFDLAFLVNKSTRPITFFLIKGSAEVVFSKGKVVLPFKINKWDCLVSAEEDAKIYLNAFEETSILIVS